MASSEGYKHSDAVRAKIPEVYAFSGVSLVEIGRILPPLRGGARGRFFCCIGIGAGVELCEISYTNAFCSIHEIDRNII